jgi:hypothetical protein
MCMEKIESWKSISFWFSLPSLLGIRLPCCERTLQFNEVLPLFLHLPMFFLNHTSLQNTIYYVCTITKVLLLLIVLRLPVVLLFANEVEWFEMVQYFFGNNTRCVGGAPSIHAETVWFMCHFAVQLFINRVVIICWECVTFESLLLKIELIVQLTYTYIDRYIPQTCPTINHDQTMRHNIVSLVL